MKQIHIIILTYIKPTEVINELRLLHREFLDIGYKQNLFIASGPNSNKTGGVILACGELSEIKALLQKDPFQSQKAAEYVYHSFDPVKHAQAFKHFI